MAYTITGLKSSEIVEWCSFYLSLVVQVAQSGCRAKPRHNLRVATLRTFTLLHPAGSLDLLIKPVKLGCFLQPFLYGFG